MVEEKSIKSKNLILSLMNTDVQGIGGHWILGIVDQEQKTIILKDTSIVLSDTFYRKYFYYLLKVLYFSHKEKIFNPNQWKLFVCLDTIQQKNAYDCGPLVIANAYAALFDTKISSVPNSEFLRKWIHSILVFEDDKQGKGSKKAENHKSDEVKDLTFIHEFWPTKLYYSYCNTNNNFAVPKNESFVTSF